MLPGFDAKPLGKSYLRPVRELRLFLQAGAGAYWRTLQAKLREFASVEDFGAVGDGIADDTAAFNAALQAKTQVYAMGSNYKLSGQVTVPAGRSLIGADSKTTLTLAAGTYSTFAITGSDVVIRNFNHVCTAKTGGYEYALVCGTSSINRTTISSIYTTDAKGLITDSGSGANGVHITTRLYDIQSALHRGPGVSFTRAFAFQFWTLVVFDYSLITGNGNANFTGFSVDSSGLSGPAGGAVLTDCDVLGNSGSYTNASQHGFSFNTCAEIWLRHCAADTCDGKGFIFTTCQLFHFADVTASLCNNTGFEFTGCSNFNGGTIRANGRVGLGVAAASIDGVRFVSGNSAIQLSNVFTYNCTGHGVNKAAAQTGALNISGGGSFNNTLRGLKSTGNSAFLLTGYQISGNTAGNYDLAGTSDYLQVSQLNSGAVVSVGPGPVTG